MEWSLVTVIPNTDLKVGKVLETRGFPFHVFRHVIQFFKNGKKFDKVVLTFPRYIFVPLMNCWEVTHVSDDVLGPVKFGDCVAKAPVGFVEGLSSKCVDDILVSTLDVINFRFGQKILVTGESHLVGKIGTYLRPASSGKAFVEFALMGRTTSVELDESILCILEVDVEKRKQRRRNSRNR